MELKEKKRGSRGARGRERKRVEEGTRGGRERPREKWAPSERGQPQATSHDATLLREGFVPHSWIVNVCGFDQTRLIVRSLAQTFSSNEYFERYEPRGLDRFEFFGLRRSSKIARTRCFPWQIKIIRTCAPLSVGTARLCAAWVAVHTLA